MGSGDGQVDSSPHGDIGGLQVGEASRIEQRCRQSKAILHLQIPAHVYTLNCYSRPLFRGNNGTRRRSCISAAHPCYHELACGMGASCSKGATCGNCSRSTWLYSRNHRKSRNATLH